jgi:hypothetical protein
MSLLDSVWAFMPPGYTRPEQVTQDGRAGVTPTTFQQFVDKTQRRITDRMALAGLSAPNFTQALPRTLDEVRGQMIAARILRFFPTHDVLRKEYWAEAYATLDEYIRLELASKGISLAAPEFVDGSEMDYGFPKL